LTKRVADMTEEEYERHRQGRLRRRREKQQALFSMFDYTCQNCGIIEETLGFFEFHHKDPHNKDKEVGSMLNSASFETVLKEVEKCIMLCPNCHKREHLKENMTLSELRSTR